MKTWKKIEETKKRTGDITQLKKRNEEKVQKVSVLDDDNFIFVHIENFRHSIGERAKETHVLKQLYDLKAAIRRKEESSRCSSPPKERGSQAS